MLVFQAHRTLLLYGHRTPLLCNTEPSCYVGKEPSCYVDIRRIDGSGKTQPFHIQSQENIKVPVFFRLTTRVKMHMATHLVLEAKKPTHINTVINTVNNTASLGALRIYSSVRSMDLGSSSLHSPEKYVREA